MFFLLLGLACSGVDPIDALGELHPVERLCLESNCLDADDIDLCRAESCALSEEIWSLSAERIGYKEETLFVEASVKYTPAAYGDKPERRASPVFVGVTAVTKSGKEIDLAVQTRFEDDIEAPFFLTAEVGSEVQDIIMGLWDHKVEPCDSERMGCKEFGFLLDGSLATWPAKVYVDGRRQRIPPAPVQLKVLSNSPAPEITEKAQATLKQALMVFESEISVELGERADGPAKVTYGHTGDAIVADQLAAALGLTAELREAGGDEFVVVIGPE